MSKAARDKPNSVSPRIVINPGAATQGADAALKGFIDDWFVPALVEEYIRLHQKAAVVMDQDPDVDGCKTEI